MTDVNANEFLFSSGVRSASFHNVGDKVVGHIIRNPEVQHQRDFDTGELKYWPDGNPMRQLRIVLMTDEVDPNDPEDSGERAIYARGLMLNAIRTAVQQSKAKGLEVGGKLLVRYVGNGTPTRKGLHPPKQYEAQYRAPKEQPVEVPAAPETEPVTASRAKNNEEIPF